MSLIDLLRPTQVQLAEIDAALAEAWTSDDRLTHRDRWLRQTNFLLDRRLKIQATPRRDDHG